MSKKNVPDVKAILKRLGKLRRQADRGDKIMSNPVVAACTVILLVVLLLAGMGAAELVSQALEPVSTALMEG